MQSSLRKLIREMLLQEEVFGAIAFFYTGSRTNTDIFVDVLAGDTLNPGKGEGAMYGKGLYTVYDLPGSQTEKGVYGKYIYKLAINFNGFISFDNDVTTKIYGEPLTPAQQADALGLGADIVNRLDAIISRKPDPAFTSEWALPASKFLKGIVKGIIFTGSRDGKVSVVYDVAAVVPTAYRTINAKKWTRVKQDTKRELAGRISGDWQEEKYEMNPLMQIRRLHSIMKRREAGNDEEMTLNGDVDLRAMGLTSLPSNLRITGTLLVDDSTVGIPANLKVGGDLFLINIQMTETPPGLEVGGSLMLPTSIERIGPGLIVGKDFIAEGSGITEIPPDAIFGRNINLESSQIQKLPDNLTVNGDLKLRRSQITTLPRGLRVAGTLDLTGTGVVSLPGDLQVDDSIILSGNFDWRTIPDHLMQGRRKDGRQKVWITG
jgi:hypothetical protein